MVLRTLEGTLKQILQKTGKSILLLGPRQVGKSTLLKSLAPSLSINFSDEVQYRDHLKDPSLLRRQVDALKTKAPIVVDEVQRIPSILNTIQALIDEKKNPSFLLSGSSARKLKSGQANLLPGRIFSYQMFPLTYWELNQDFSLDKALTVGTLPEIYLNDYGPELLTNYIDAYLKEEVQAEALVRDIRTYAKFLDLAALCSGQSINYHQIASDSEIPKETLRRYFNILTDTLIVRRLPGFNELKKDRKATQKEKFIFFDMGVRNAVLKQHRNQFNETELGPLFEQWIILQVMAFAEYHKKAWNFFYYRDEKKKEVDLVVDTGKKLIAIEIKYSKKVRQSYFESLEIFKKFAKRPTKAYLVFRGTTPEKWGEITALPYEEFLGQLSEF